MLGWAMDIPASEREWDIGGFLDNRPGILDGYKRPFGIVGDPDTYRFTEDDRVICAIADPGIRLEYARKLAARGARFTQLIHPTAIISFNCSIGEGSALGPLAGLDCDVTIGDHVVVNGPGVVGHDTVVGNGCHLGTCMVLSGGCRLGEGVFIGANATVNENLVLGDRATVGSGSVATKHVPGGMAVMGVPARPIKELARARRSGRPR